MVKQLAKANWQLTQSGFGPFQHPIVTDWTTALSTLHLGCHPHFPAVHVPIGTGDRRRREPGAACREGEP